jgi:hypothetical protein
MLSSFSQGSAASSSHRHWRETAGETIWTQQYSNCDYGYYDVIPDGFIAHAAKAPSSNHGAIIDLADAQDANPLASPPDRYIRIWNQYNAASLPSLDAIVHDEIESARQDKRGFLVVGKESATLGGLTATIVRMSYIVGSKKEFEIRAIAYRPPGRRGLGDIIYMITLVTTEEAFVEDKGTFDRVVSGFHLTKLSVGSCSNE